MSVNANPLAAATSRLRAAGADTNLEQLRQVVDSMVPFNNFVGIRITELTPTYAIAEVPVRDELLNHFGTVHAGALFLAAEVAGAGAFSGAMAPRILSVQRFVLRESKVAFLKPATGTSLLHDDAGTLVARVDLDYVAWVAAA